jgi:hypothetical protein
MHRVTGILLVGGVAGKAGQIARRIASRSSRKDVQTSAAMPGGGGGRMPAARVARRVLAEAPDTLRMPMAADATSQFVPCSPRLSWVSCSRGLHTHV